MGGLQRRADESTRVYSLFGIVHVYPGALIPYIGHFEKIWIETRSPNGLPEERFMGPWRAGRDNDPVQISFLYRLFHSLLSIDGTGIQAVLNVHNIGKRPGELPYLGYIDHPPDVLAAVTHENTYPGSLPGYILLRRPLFLTDHRTPLTG